MPGPEAFPGLSAPRDPFAGFGEEEGGRLVDLLQREFLPELERARGRRGKFEDIFTKFLDPRAGEESVSRGAERIALDVLRPGGNVTEAIRSARGRSIASGFGTTGGDLSRQEANIVSEGLRSSVGSFVGQSLPALFEGAAGRAERARSLSQQQVVDLIESLFTGLAGAESLRLADEAQDDKFLGLF